MDVVISDDEKYPDFDINTIMASEGIALKAKAGIANRAELRDGLDTDDPEAWRALVWLLRTRKAREDGTPLPRLSETDFPWGSCRFEFNEAEQARIASAMDAARAAARAGEPAPEVETDPNSPDPTAANPNT